MIYNHQLRLREACEFVSLQSQEEVWVVILLGDAYEQNDGVAEVIDALKDNNVVAFIILAIDHYDVWLSSRLVLCTDRESQQALEFIVLKPEMLVFGTFTH